MEAIMNLTVNRAWKENLQPLVTLCMRSFIILYSEILNAL